MISRSAMFAIAVLTLSIEKTAEGRAFISSGSPTTSEATSRGNAESEKQGTTAASKQSGKSSSDGPNQSKQKGSKKQGNDTP